jgi:hypothetical protein
VSAGVQDSKAVHILAHVLVAVHCRMLGVTVECWKHTPRDPYTTLLHACRTRHKVCVSATSHFPVVDTTFRLPLVLVLLLLLLLLRCCGPWTASSGPHATAA